MPVSASGVKTHLDDVFVGFTKAEISAAIDEYVKINSSNTPVNQTKRASPERKAILLKNALKTSLAKPIQRYAYRAMDNRLVFYVPEAIEAGDHRYPVMRHLVKDNLALVTVRQLSQGHFAHAFVTRSIADMCLLSTATKECAYIFPLHLETEDGLPGVDSCSTNLSIPTQTYLSKAKATPESFLHYVYALLHSPKYRRRYTEFLKIDFPRLPLAENINLYRVLSHLGREISLLHLLELPKVESFITQLLGEKIPSIEKVSWSANTVWIDKAQMAGFKGVTEDVWNFHIGGYQVCEKWLKDRKGRKLTKDDIEHYQKIVVAISETIRLMAEIDKVIDEHGGWPGAFQGTK
jgi:predicted helicase